MNTVHTNIVPAKNAIKRYLENGYYHIYNRGVAKNLIFLNDQDYGVFLHYLKEYLSPPKIYSLEEIKKKIHRYSLKNYNNEIELMAFCLMPNHFHLLLKQNKERSIESFMRSLCGRYTSYFNKNHQRVGHLYQGIYKAVLVQNEEYFWWLSRYIHRNPEKNFASYPYSSYSCYLGKTTLDWLHPEEILAQIKNYQAFVEGEEEKIPETSIDLILEQPVETT